MTRRVALVVGPTGAAGAPLVQALAREGGWEIHGLSRSPPGPGAPFTHLAADLADPESCIAALRRLEPVTHAFYAARAPFSEGGVEDVAANLRFLRTMLDGVEASDRLEHVHLITGIKWYGMHLGPYPTPAREDDPRHLPPNFYYDQQDLLASRSAAARWSWSSSRPSYICDGAPDRARNLAAVLGAYAAVCRELQVRLDFPGTRAGFEALREVTDARCLADAVVFLARNRCTGAYNVTNGDAFRWSRVWPRLAEWFGIPCGEPRDLRLVRWMADKQPVWDRIVERYRLRPRSLPRVAAWDFGDFVFRQAWDVLSDVGRLRRTGFNGSVDTLDMFERQIDAYREARILPP